MAHYDRGATLCIEGLDSRDEHLAALASTVKRELNFLGTTDIRVYLSPDKQGFDVHFDARIATTLPIEGQKRWRYSEEVAVDWPHFQLPVGFDPARTSQPGEMCKPPSECHFHEVVLKPGDILCCLRAAGTARRQSGTPWPSIWHLADSGPSGDPR